MPVLDAVFTLFGRGSSAVMWRDVADTPEREQVQLGLARVAVTDLVFRHGAMMTPYAEEHPRGRGINFVGSRGIHKWVRDEWKRLQTE